MRTFPESQPKQEGSENNIQAGQETGIGDAGIQDADLLQGCGGKKDNAGEEHPLPLGRWDPSAARNEWNQKDGCQ